MFSSLRYFWSEAFKSLFRNQFMAIASVLTVTVSMFILGGFLYDDVKYQPHGILP